MMLAALLSQDQHRPSDHGRGDFIYIFIYSQQCFSEILNLSIKNDMVNISAKGAQMVYANRYRVIQALKLKI